MSTTSQKPPAGGPQGRSPAVHRRVSVNWKALAILGIAAVLAVLGLFESGRLQKGRLRQSALAGSQEALKEGRRDLAIQQLDRFLGRYPDDVPVMEELSDLLSSRPSSFA